MKLFHTLTTLLFLITPTLSLPVHTPRLRSCDPSCHSCPTHPSLTSSICLPFRSTLLVQNTLRADSSNGGLTGDACAATTDCSPGRGCGRLQNDGSIATCADPSDACFCFPTDFKICDANGQCTPGEVCAQEAQGNVQLCVAKTSPLLEEAAEEKETVVTVDANKGDKDLPTVPPVTTVPQTPPAPGTTPQTPPVAPPVSPPAQQESPEPEPVQESAPAPTPAVTAAVSTPTVVPTEETPTETAVASAEPAVTTGSEEPAPVPVPAESSTETETSEETVTESGTETTTEEASVPTGTTDTEVVGTEEAETDTTDGVATETDEEEESEDPSATGEDDESIDGAAVDDDDDTNSAADGDDGDDDDEDEDEVCIGAHHLQSVHSLVYDSHRKAKVLCDSMGSCATPGHIVHWKGQAMMMASYCELVQEECVRKSMLVNSPTWKRGLRVESLTEGLQFTAFAARYATRTEERLLTAAVRVGL